MAVLFEATCGDIVMGLAQVGNSPCSPDEFIAQAFDKIGKKIQHNGLTFTISRIIKFDI